MGNISGVVVASSAVSGSVSKSKGNSKAELVFSTRAEFPENGDGGFLYIAQDENVCYRFDEEMSEYVSLGADLSNYYTKDELYKKTELYPRTNLYPKTQLYKKSELYNKDELYNREEIDVYLALKADAEHTHDYMPLSGGKIESADFCPLSVYSDSVDGVAIRLSSYDTDGGQIGFDCDGNFIVQHGADAADNTLELSGETHALKTNASGALLHLSFVNAAVASLTIDNLSTYAAILAYITGKGADSADFAINAVIPVAYLARSTSNTFNLAGGIPSSASANAGYIIASMTSENVLKLELFSEGTQLSVVQLVALY